MPSEIKDEVLAPLGELTSDTPSKEPKSEPKSEPNEAPPVASQAAPWIEVKATPTQAPAIRSSASGVVSDLQVSDGDEVIRGQKLFVVRNSRLSSDIETVKLSINSLEALAKSSDTAEIKETLAEEKAKLRTLQEQQKVVVKAPKAGTIKTVKVKSGDSIRKGSVVVTLRSRSRILQYMIPAKQAVGIEKNATVEIRDSAGQISQTTVSSKKEKDDNVIITLKSGKRKGAVTAIRLVPAQ